MPHITSINTRSRRTATAIVLAGVVLLGAVVDAHAASAIPDARHTVGDICQTVIRLEPGGAAYEACVASLAETLHGQDHLAQQTPIATPTSTLSYFYASQSEIHRREVSSCERLGLRPGDSASANCVANLDDRLFEADNPAQ